MTLSMFQASVPVFITALGNLSTILDKAEAHAAAKKIDPSIFLNARLAPDMFPLTKQVQIASDVIKGSIARLAGVEVPSYADTETSFAELKERIAKTVGFIKTASHAMIDGTEEKPIQLKVGGNELNFRGQDYLFRFVLPNVYFHITTAYAILRHNGVELGKRDFLGA